MKPSLECGFCPSSYNRVPDGIVRDIVEVWSRLRQFISFPTTTESGVVLMKDFFISYNSADRQWAEWIAWQLEEAGYTTVLQAWDFRPGSNFVLEMQRAATEAERTIAVLSPDYLGARFTQPEWAAAFAQDPTGEKGTLLPVRVRECDLKGLLPQIIYIDLVGLEEAAAKDALLAGVSRARAKPTAPPGFPGIITRSVPQRPRFPGALPSTWNIPLLRNPNFTGRESLLAELRAALTSGQPAALTQAISGLGGVGKTQLAVEYAYRHAADYDVVWWVRAEEPATLAADYASLAGPLGLPQKEEPDQRVVVEAVRRWLGQNAGWLLVFDNAPGPAQVRDYLPQAATGHVLITSRSPVWRGVASPLTVQVMERPESVDFLLKRTGQADEEAADALAEALGDLPLALEQAGAYVEASGGTLSGYLRLFRRRHRELLRRGKPSTDYPDTVATTWELSFQQVQQASPAGADLLSLCAFLAPDDIPRNLLSEGAQHLPQPLADAVVDALAFDEALAALRRYSLVEVGGDALSVHRLVQAVACDRLPEKAQRTWAEAAAGLVNSVFPSGIQTDMQTWPHCARLLPHALAAAGHAEALEVASEATARLLNQAGLYLQGRAEFAEARAASERALAIDEAVFGPDHPKVATMVNNLGLVLRDLGDLAGAREALQRALAIWEKQLGPDHPNVASALNNLGMVLQDLGDLAGAGAAFERALAIWEKQLGPDHPNVASAVNNLGSVLRDLGDLAGARAAFERALAIDEAAFGHDHLKVATAVNNLGIVLRDLGDLAGAWAAFERALAIFEKALGADHPNVATLVNNLGLVLQALGDLAGARAAFERALAIDEAAFGPDHPNVAKDLWNLGTVLQKQEEIESAREAYGRALATFERFLGPNHQSTRGVRQYLDSLPVE
jgi:tetratricopeptide (TPR) repeat protein